MKKKMNKAVEKNILKIIKTIFFENSFIAIRSLYVKTNIIKK